MTQWVTVNHASKTTGLSTGTIRSYVRRGMVKRRALTIPIITGQGRPTTSMVNIVQLWELVKTKKAEPAIATFGNGYAELADKITQQVMKRLAKQFAAAASA